MKKIIFGIFAHPDDEAFGISGALLAETKASNDLHLITYTLGDAGTNPDNAPNLGAVREQEWRTSGRLIGAKTMTWLGYKDGQLDNLTMIEAQEKILSQIRETIQDEPHDIELEIISMDTNGISGHIDHIVAGRSANYVFYKLKETEPRTTRLRLATIPVAMLPTPNTHWLYMDAGRDESEIGEIVDAREYRDEIITIMRAHHSQRGDGESHIKNRGDSLGLCHFIVKT